MTKCLFLVILVIKGGCVSLQHNEILKNNLKKPKGQLEAVNRIMTENTMAKRKRTNNDLQTTTQETKD